MNKVKLLFLMFCLVSCMNTNKVELASIAFAEEEFSFGELDYKKEQQHVFRFVNKSANPLIIFDVKTSCGCTVANWTKTPVKPSSSGEIKVSYDAEFPGMFNKEINVYFNGSDSPRKLLIKGQVKYPDNEE